MTFWHYLLIAWAVGVLPMFAVSMYVMTRDVHEAFAFGGWVDLIFVLAIFVVVAVFWALVWPVTLCLIAIGQYRDWCEWRSYQ